MIKQTIDNAAAIVYLEIIDKPERIAYEVGETEYNLEGIKALGKAANGAEIELEADRLILTDFDTGTIGYIDTWVVVKGGTARALLRLIVVQAGGLTGMYMIEPYDAPKETLNGRQIETGSAAASVFFADEGEQLQLFAEPNYGFALVELAYICDDNRIPIPLNSGIDGKFDFIMPAGSIKLDARFEWADYMVSAAISLKPGVLSLHNERTGKSGASINARRGDSITITFDNTFSADSVNYTWYDAGKNSVTGPGLYTEEEKRNYEAAGLSTTGVTQSGGSLVFEMPPGNTTITAQSAISASAVEVKNWIDNTAYNTGDSALDLTGFQYIVIYEDSSKIWFRKTAERWESSASGDGWTAFNGITPSTENFSGFDGISPFDSSMAGGQNLIFTLGDISAGIIGGGEPQPLTITVNMENAVCMRFDASRICERYYTSLQAAITASAGFQANNQDVITLLKNIDLTSGISLASGKHIELYSDSEEAAPRVIRRGGTSAFGSFFLVESGASLTLSGNLTLDGGAVWAGGSPDAGVVNSGKTATGALVWVNGGTFTLKNGVMLTKNHNTAGDTGTGNVAGGVYITNGGFTMDGGKINFCASSVLAAAVKSWGGGLYAYKESGATLSVTINGGEISQNYAKAGGAAAVHGSSAYLSMGEGSIRGNRYSEGAVYLSNSELKISGRAVIERGDSVFLQGGKILIDGILYPPSYTAGGNTVSGLTAEIEYQGNIIINEDGFFSAGNELQALEVLIFSTSTYTAENKRFFAFKRPSQMTDEQWAVFEPAFNHPFDHPADEFYSMARASGGKISFVSSAGIWDEIHTFTASGTLAFSGDVPANARLLVVAGGGAGGNERDTQMGFAGGGGAGGYYYNAACLLSASSYAVTVGAGGLGGTAYPNYMGAKGGDSSFGSIITVPGGGYGGGDAAAGFPISGGSGGGGGAKSNGESTGKLGSEYGNAGANGSRSISGYGGGGGGAGGAASGYFGGTGRNCDITGRNIMYAKGGKGAMNDDARPALSGADNTGNGGNGAWRTTSGNYDGGNGGSGIVVVRFPRW
jgi:hypothetical protein